MCKILIVDDEVSYRQLLHDVFREQGWVVRTAAGSKDANELSAEFHPNVLIVDWMLGEEQDGSAVVELFRKLNPNLEIVYISGYPNVTLQSALESDPRARWMAKPFHLDDMIGEVRSLCLSFSPGASPPNP